MKIKALFIAVFLVSFLFLLSACEEKEEVPQPVSLPAINTLGVEIPAGGGVILRAGMENYSQLSGYGFILGTDQLITAGRKIIPAQENHKDGIFTATIEKGLLNGRPYFFKGYMVMAGDTILGEYKSFVSGGSIAPVINSIIPENGHLEDTIQIKGENFGTIRNYVSATFEGKSATVLAVNDSVISVVVPAELSIPKNRIVVSVDGKTSNVSGIFELEAPKITSLLMEEATFREILEIQGDHFDFADARNKVWIGNIEAVVVYSSRNKIKVVVPDNIASANEPIRIQTQLQTVVSPQNFKLKAPEIQLIPAAGRTSEIITIQGNGFHPESFNNKVFFGEAEAEVISGNNRELQIRVPEGPYPERFSFIKVAILGQSGISATTFTVEDAWLLRTKSLPFYYHRGLGTFVINEIAYVIAGSSDFMDNKLYLWVFDPSSSEWEKRDVPIQIKWTGLVVANEQKAFIYTAQSGNSFYEYDPANDTWEERAVFPGARRDGPAGFSIDGEIYIGMGADFEPYSPVPYKDFYKYSPQTDSWQQVQDLDGRGGEHAYFPRSGATTFVLNGFAFLMGGANHSGMDDCWKYDPERDSWSEVASFAFPISNNSTFSMNGRGYVTSGGTNACYEYNPANNSWQTVDEIGHQNISGGFSFVANGTAYAGGIIGLNGLLYELDRSRMEAE